MTCYCRTDNNDIYNFSHANSSNYCLWMNNNVGIISSRMVVTGKYLITGFSLSLVILGYIVIRNFFHTSHTEHDLLLVKMLSHQKEYILYR